MTEPAWRPVLDGELATRALARVEAIAQAIDAAPTADPTLANGQAGVAVLHGYRALAGSADGEGRAVAALGVALEHLDQLVTPWLFVGHAGVAFALRHLAPVVGEATDTLAVLDELLASVVGERPTPYAWELVDGLIGLGVYALEADAGEVVARVVDHLAACAERDAGGVAWRTHDPGDARRFHNLGIAHGVAGAIAFLAEVARRPDAPVAAAELVRGAVPWLRARARPDHVPEYPMTLGERALRHDGILDGWCYGDPSTALVLVRAGHALGEPAWIEDGRALAHRVARRTEAELAPITIDATLCHGAIGQALLLHHLGHALDDDALRAAARSWYTRALGGPELPMSAPGIQLGLAGLALGLLAGATAVPPRWARMLLL